MASTSIISVSRLTKTYRLGVLASITDTARNTLRWLRGRGAVTPDLFKALDCIDLDVQQGEVLGIIGHNGAGKSTLLKILAGVVTPTSGSLRVRGKIAPLIELGAGLVPDMTGRENIYLNGAILGMKRREIAKKFDDIVAFAELEDFIDTPIKRYSSGMQVRIGFAVATAVDSDILIVDEVLAVGDLAFQRKCFDRIEGIIKRSGKTVLFVSHNIRQVSRMCSRVVLLDHGHIVADGRPAEVTELFYEQSNRKIQADKANLAKANTKVASTGEVELRDLYVCDSYGTATHELVSGGTLRVRIFLQVNAWIYKPEVVVGTHTTDFVYLTAASTALYDDRPDFAPGMHEVEYSVPAFPLVAGTYGVRVSLFDGQGRQVLSGETLYVFHVRPLPHDCLQPTLRNLNVPTEWTVDGQRFSDVPDSSSHLPARVVCTAR